MEPNHPQSHFTAGNRYSLTEYPKKTFGIDAFEELHKFYNRNYCSRWMTAVLQANLPIDELQTLASKYLEQIPDRGQTAPERNLLANPKMYSAYDGVKIPKIVRLIPARNYSILSLTIPFTPQRDNYTCHPVEFLRAVLSADGPGSLSRYIIDEKLGSGVYAYQLKGDSKYSSDLQIL